MDNSVFGARIGSITIALGALASLAAIIWQVVNEHAADSQLTGLVGLLFGAFLKLPGHTDQIQIAQPQDQPIPVVPVGGAEVNV